MKVIGIVQPGKIGDIIICLPIAKHYHDLGHKVIWPISSEYIKHFQDYIDYVEFIPITNDLWKCINEARNVTKDCTRLELAFSYPNTPTTTAMFDSKNIPFDKVKYQIANVPFDKKWTLELNRNKDREDALYSKICNKGKYVVCHFEGSGFKREIKLDNEGDFDIVKVSSMTDSVFDWLRVLEGASKLVLVDSCFSNLVEQRNLTNQKYFLLRSPFKITPTIKNVWDVIQ